MYKNSVNSSISQTPRYPSNYKLSSIGLKVCFDGIKVKDQPCFHLNLIKYQACGVFAGTWPLVPPPTAFPRCPGSNFSPDFQGNQTFYYLNTDLAWTLDIQLRRFVDEPKILNLRSRLQSYITINNKHDYFEWKNKYAPSHYILDRPWQRNSTYYKKTAGDVFGYNDQIMVKMEPKEEEVETQD